MHENLNTLSSEFRKAFHDRRYKIDPKTQIVVVLSGESFWDENNIPIERAGIENWVRVAFGIDVVKYIASKRAKKPSFLLTQEEIDRFGPFLCLNGETEQLPILEEMATGLNFPCTRIIPMDCGKQGYANSKTQMHAINRDLPPDSRLVIVTSDYHVPRARRTADVQLLPSMSFTVLSAPHYAAEQYPWMKFIRGEIGRVIRYTQTGDISAVPSRG